MIISTTFGNNEEGKFRRNFGPLSGANGGRRLNVLVTRARQRIHVVTSIPRAEYMAGYEIPPGTQPNGRLLLYDYLKYAEQIEAEFRDNYEALEEAAVEFNGKMVNVQSDYPSNAALAWGSHLHATRQMGGFTHWGNDGFCVDVAVRNPQKPLRVTIGVMADFNRYGKAPDPIQWEAFRYSILVGLTKWKLVRTWSPVTFRALNKVDSDIDQAHAVEMS